MPLVSVGPPQRSIFCGADFGSTTTLDLQLKFKTVYGTKSFLSKESDTLRSYRVYISPTIQASSALIQIEIEDFPTFFSGTNGNAIFSWNLWLFHVVQKFSSLNFRDFQRFSQVYFSEIYIFMQVHLDALRNILWLSI